MSVQDIKLQFTNLVLRCVSVGNAALMFSEKEIGKVLTSALKKQDVPFIQSVQELGEKIQEFSAALSKQQTTPAEDDPQPAEATRRPRAKKQAPTEAPVPVPEPELKAPEVAPEPVKKKATSKKAKEEPAPAPVPAAGAAPEEPKLSAYALFFKENRAKIATANPGWNAQQITTEIGRQWSEQKKAGAAEPAPAPAQEPVEEAATTSTDDDKKQPLHVRRKKIPKSIRTLVWNKYIGADITAAKCCCCREEKITLNNWHCGHVVAESKGGDTTINNLRPVCAPCNSSMGAKSMNEFTEEFFGWSI